MRRAAAVAETASGEASCRLARPCHCTQQALGRRNHQHPAAQVFYATRASIPDVARPPPPSPDAGGGVAVLERLVLRFDSLASLPTRLPSHMAAPPGEGSGGGDAPPPPPLPRPALEAVAAHLRRALGLTLFGFDVVVCSESGDWLVVVGAGPLGRRGGCGAASPSGSLTRRLTLPPPPRVGRQLLPQLQGRPARDTGLAGGGDGRGARTAAAGGAMTAGNSSTASGERAGASQAPDRITCFN